MTSRPLRLALFDVDGTLVDSQHMIVAAMRRAFETMGLAPPSHAETIAIVGLSLPQAMAALAPTLSDAASAQLVQEYKTSFVALRAETGGEAAVPLYPGAREAVEALDASDWLLGVATGKARRGLDHMLDAHAMRRYFTTLQTADDAPSKPHPGMALNALRETGVEAGRAVMIGDTSFDMAMGRAAGLRAIGVAWGYHPVEALREAGAEIVIESFDALGDALARLAP